MVWLNLVGGGMSIKALSSLTPIDTPFPLDRNSRVIHLYKIEDAQSLTTNYPTVILYAGGQLINPIEERIMSLADAQTENSLPAIVPVQTVEPNPVFFFCYNTDNYYHFVYDTLPYLITFLRLRNTIPNLKLLMHPQGSVNYFYPFVWDFLGLLGIIESDVVMLTNYTAYKELYVSSSFTHGIDSNLPPRKEVYELFSRFTLSLPLTKKLYISRRSNKHGDYTNIGTNYTTRRLCVNEEQLVDYLSARGYQEVFTELLTAKAKIELFSTASHVFGAIGGGMCNVLFSPKHTQVFTLVSPTFLDVNSRFRYCFSKVNNQFLYNTSHVEEGAFKKYMRVQFPLGGRILIGEIEDIIMEGLTIKYCEENVAGWNQSIQYKYANIHQSACKPLDGGLNSPWSVDLNALDQIEL